ncbi:Hypothetical Protein SLY_0909 [Strawberry lethal yellows phytoplasma (CPA) str. NZSb11]|uniref:Uncharacterized protein n=1 Tax=Strawberry lethal yellows phytoplasma (CPA) str. NZSb11 TaxID=980422 RepID=R4S1X4_PHYAS|nr:Hypothetical Protein SLY_0909 [Strawberry lethal yellows phytoplasma (CPA) str. NZSb11]
MLPSALVSFTKKHNRGNNFIPLCFIRKGLIMEKITNSSSQNNNKFFYFIIAIFYTSIVIFTIFFFNNVDRLFSKQKFDPETGHRLQPQKIITHNKTRTIVIIFYFLLS